MIRKTLLALATLVSMSAADMAPAFAKVNIDINIGYGGWGVIGVRPGRGTCVHGLRIVNRRFNHVSVRDCRGRVYSYFGWRNGRRFVIRMDSYNGRIIDVLRW